MLCFQFWSNTSWDNVLSINILTFCSVETLSRVLLKTPIYKHHIHNNIGPRPLNYGLVLIYFLTNEVEKAMILACLSVRLFEWSIKKLTFRLISETYMSSACGFISAQRLNFSAIWNLRNFQNPVLELIQRNSETRIIHPSFSSRMFR